MKAPHIAWAFWLTRRLKLLPRERLVFMAIAERADDSLSCAPTLDTLTVDTGLSLHTVKQTVGELLARKDCIARCERLRQGAGYKLLRPYVRVPARMTDTNCCIQR